MNDPHLTRRKLLGAAAAAGVAVAGGAAFLDRAPSPANAQDASGATATPVPLGGAIPDEFTVDTDWPYENLSLSATRAAKGTTIAAANINTLGAAWSFPVKAAGAFGALTANPTIAGDVVYIQDAAANVYALKKATGETVWSKMYNDTVPSGGPNGVAAAYGKLFTTVGGVGDVVCLDPANGNEIWKTNIKGRRGEGITVPPLVYNNLVIVSTIPGSSTGFYVGGQRGVLYGLDAASGTVLWYFDTTTDNLWGNPTVNSGGGLWHPPSVDEEGQIYFGTGNPAPYPGTKEFPWGTSRPGDNLYTDSIIKMDPQKATIDWYYQVNPHDLFDADNQLTPILFDLSGRKAVITTGKHGVVYCLDRATGETIWKTPVGTHNNDTIKTDQGDKSISVSPGTLGGVETQPAYHEASGLLIVPVYELPTQYIGSGIDPKAGFDFSTATGILVAINVKDGSIAWQTKLATGPLAGATITNDLVFSAGLDGVLRAFTVADGKEVFNYQLPAGVNAQLAVSGDYVYVAAGGPLMTKEKTKAAFNVVALKLGGDTSMASPVAENPTGGATPQTSTQGSGAAPGPNSSTPEAATPTS